MPHGIKKINEWIMRDGRTINVTHNISPEKLEGGTLHVKPLDGGLKFLKVDSSGRKSWDNFNPNIIFKPNSIQTIILGDQQVTTPKIADLNVTTIKYANLSITNEKYANLSISANKLQTNSVIHEKIAPSAVIESKIMDSAVTNTKLRDQAVTTSKIMPLNIINSLVAENTIQNSKLLDNTLTFQKIKEYTIHGGQTFSFSGNQTHKGQIAQATVTDWNMADSAVIERVLARNSVTHHKIMDNQIYGNKIPDKGIKDKHIETLDGRKLIALSVEAERLAVNSVITSKIMDNNVTRAKLEPEIQRLMDLWIRVKSTQSIFGTTHNKTAWVKGNLVVRDDENINGNVNVSVQGAVDVTGDLTAARCFNPVYADLAEGYVPRGIIEAGDPVALCKEGDLKVEHLNENNCDRFIGFASDEYATVFGASPSEIKAGEKIAVTLTGRIKVKLPKLRGEIGNYLTYVDGKFLACKGRSVNAIGRLLEDSSSDKEYILCQLWA